jgi:hypothetical protein
MKHVMVLGAIVALSWSSVYAGDGLEATLDELMSRHQQGADAPKDFEIPEADANSYIRARSLKDFPEGIESPWVRFEESLAIVGATLDIDKLHGQLPDSIVFRFLSGRVPVEIAARINAAAGVGKLVLERVTLSGVDLPPDMVASLISEEDASEYLPPGFRLGQAFTLPFDLESILCQPGTVTVRQRATAAAK